MSGDPYRGTDCSEVLLRVFEYIDHEMTTPDCERFKVHLEECGDCLSEYHRDVLLKTIVRRSCGPERAPKALRLQILAQITHVSVDLGEA
ncbi:MAG: mycothiol system anti-sigma-R factor [Austwickia sp.]|nr:mycothiol system anti-sigma-R factor [Austwickia sp.]MBK8435920.1 mycothiol system anti-sigma-R factor [Austwickia sp.]MBK9101605.1 mycothiol system anti-sigma-R factor [Austwickia sp.]